MLTISNETLITYACLSPYWTFFSQMQDPDDSDMLRLLQLGRPLTIWHQSAQTCWATYDKYFFFTYHTSCMAGWWVLVHSGHGSNSNIGRVELESKHEHQYSFC